MSEDHPRTRKGLPTNVPFDHVITGTTLVLLSYIVWGSGFIGLMLWGRRAPLFSLISGSVMGLGVCGIGLGKRIAEGPQEVSLSDAFAIGVMPLLVAPILLAFPERQYNPGIFGFMAGMLVSLQYTRRWDGLQRAALFGESVALALAGFRFIDGMAVPLGMLSGILLASAGVLVIGSAVRRWA